MTLPNPDKPIRVSENVTILPPKPSPPRKKLWLTTTAPAKFDNVALVSAGLGIMIGVGMSVTAFIPSAGIYMISLGLFHLLEFVITAKYNFKNLAMHSFLLTNGIGYAAAQLFTAVEYIVRWKRLGHPPESSGIWVSLGIMLIISGQTIRSAAMIQAAQSFNHYIQREKREDHSLVKSGIYAIVRHPSYFGYYLWVMGSQIALQNQISLLVFVAVIHWYFIERIKVEEESLVEFFGDDYRTYRKQVWSGIPFA